MARSINTSTWAAIDGAASVNMAHLIHFALDTDQYLTDYMMDIDYGSNTYESSEYLLGFSDINESSTIRVGSMSIELSSVGQAFTSIFLTYPYVGKQVIIRRAIMNSTSNAIIGDPVIIYDGRIESFSMNEGNSNSTISIGVASHWSDFEKQAGRYTNTNSQSLFFSGDKGFDFAANSVKDLKWGRA